MGFAVLSGVLRKRLALQVALALILASLVPLLGGAWITLVLLERSITEQVRSSQERLALAAGTLTRDYLRDATTKLKSIGHMLKESKDPAEQARRLNGLIDPPDIFLEVSYRLVGQEEQTVVAQAQQFDFSNSQAAAVGLRGSNRALDPRLNQVVANWANDHPLIRTARDGAPYVSDRVEEVKGFRGLPISAPAPNGAVLTAVVDLRPLQETLAALAGDAGRVLDVRTSGGEPVVSTSERDWSSAAFQSLRIGGVTLLPPEAIGLSRPAGHADWTVGIDEPAGPLLRPLRAAQAQTLAWFGVAFVLGAVASNLFAARVVRPVKTLAATADALGRGDYAARSGLRSDDEIGQLAAAFDRMAAAVQEVDRLKGDFVAHVSHELRTPLTSAKMTLANVQEGLAGPDTLGRVQQDLDRLIRMVNELLDAARLDAGLPLSKQPSDLGAIARSAVDGLRPLARVPVEVRGQGATLDVDPAQVRQIVINLVDNALKYARSRVDVELRGREIRVTDDGPGVPPEDRERIFERFAKVGSGPKPPGAGLGLSISRAIAERHGGTLVCEGRTFVLRL